MKTRKIKFISSALAILFVLGMIPYTSFPTKADTDQSDVVLSDGSKWILQDVKDDQGQSCNTFSADNKGGYIISTSSEGDSNSKSAFKLMEKKAFPALTSVHNLCVDYRGNTYFGFSLEGKTDSTSRVTFYRSEVSNNTSIIMSDGDTDLTVASFVATRANLADIGIVNVGSSYYMSYRGNVINGDGYSDEVKELVKLENYFPADYLKSDGMLYFFFGAGALGAGTPVKYTAPDCGEYISNVYTYLNGAGTDRNNAASMSYYNHANVSYTSKQKIDEYVLECGSGLKETALTTPVAAFGDGETETTPFVPYFSYSTPNPEWVIQNWHSVLLTNDPYSDDDSECDWIWLVRVDGAGSPHIIYNGQTLAQCTNMLFDPGNVDNEYYGACYTWKFVKDDNGNVQLQVLLNGNQLSFAANLNKVKADKPIYIKYRCPDISTSPSANMKLKIEIPKTTAIYSKVTELKNTINSLSDADLETTKTILDSYVSSDLKPTVSYSEKELISEAWSKVLSPTAKVVDEMAEPYLESEVNWYIDREEITPVIDKYSELDKGIANSYVVNSAKIKNMKKYLEEISDPDAENLITIKKSIMGTSTLTSKEALAKFDYRKDGTVDILDLVRAKKLCSD